MSKNENFNKEASSIATRIIVEGMISRQYAREREVNKQYLLTVASSLCHLTLQRLLL